MVNMETYEARAMDRFTPEPNTGCWLWTGFSYFGYGYLNIHGTPRRAHRFLFERLRGPIPEKMVLRHSCDTPSCVNPDHLTVGTHAENVADRERRGRGTKSSRGWANVGKKGAKHHAFVLTDKLRASIRTEYRKPVIRASRGCGPSRGSIEELANRFGVSPDTVRKALREF